MKSKVKLGFFVIILLGLISCSSSDEEIDGDKEYVSTYVCPVHCEGSGSSKEGTCPSCYRDYVKNDLYGHAEEKIVYDDYYDSH